jgi:hypothetical protein
MRAVKIHGILLAIVMLIALQTWTRDEGASARAAAGATSVWEGDVDDIASVTYENPAFTVRIVRRREPGDASGETLLWGTSQSKTPPADTTQPPQHLAFPVGDAGEVVLESVASLRALRVLGEPDAEMMEEYELNEPGRRLAVEFADGERQLLLGATVVGGAHRYALDPETGQGYVISYDVLRPLEGGWTSLQSTVLHAYEASDIAGITLRTTTGERRMVREGNGTAATWARPDAPGEPDQTFANFMERLQQVSIFAYDAALNVDTLQFIVRIDEADDRDRPLGFLEMFRTPANEQGMAEYYVRTEATRIPAHAYRSVAERVAQDLADIF